MDEDNCILVCPECESDEVALTAEQMFMANTGELYCQSVKTHDEDAKAKCLGCEWRGRKDELKSIYSEE